MHVERFTQQVWCTKKEKYVEVTVQVAVSMTEIAAELATKAYNSKGKRAQGVSGAVELKIIT